MKPSVKNFSVPEMVSNDNGKTSGSGTMGCICICIGCLGFIYGSYDYSYGTKTNEILSQAMLLVMVGAGLLGVRKVGGSFGKTTEISEPTKTEVSGKVAEKSGEDKESGLD